MVDETGEVHKYKLEDNGMVIAMWHKRPLADNFSNAVVIDAVNNYYMGTDDGKLVKMNGTTEDTIWIYRLLSPVIATPALSSYGTVYFGNRKGEVYSFLIISPGFGISFSIKYETMTKMLLSLLKIALILYVSICLVLYFFQERLIYFPEKLSKDFKFRFYHEFEEVNIRTADNVLLNAVLFRSASSKGVIFYLHGNAGSINSWGDVAEIYTRLQYDLFMLDYRGYGKSEGQISGQEQFYSDVQKAYDILKTRYDESKIIVLGYSIGTGPATKIAAENNPKLLILQSPYYSLTDMMRHTYPVIPTFILKYKFETNKFIKKCKMPIVIFHGDKDEIIYYGSAVKLKGLMKGTDRLITLRGQGHNGMSSNAGYLMEMERILGNSTRSDHN